MRFAPLALLLLAPALALAGDKPADREALEKQVRQLEKDIEKVRGLAFKKPVVFHVIARPRDASPGIQGYYDTKKKALFLYDDIKGNYQKGVLIHEMIHALQDQHFGLQKLHASSFGSDAETALAALIEGDATYTMIEMLQKEQPFVAKMLNTTLEKSRNVENAFLYGVGAKYVQELKKRGDWQAVNLRYQFTPTSTAAILHPGQRITPVTLGPGKSVGEFGIIKLFHSDEATRALCVKAAAGWRGDRAIDDPAGQAWLVAFATEEQARTFRETLALLRSAQTPKVKPVTEGEAQVWKGPKTVRAILQRGTRVLEVTAPDDKARAVLLDRAFGPPKVEVYSAAEKKVLTFGELTDRLMHANFVCIGESHDNEIHHAVQLMVVKALYARDESLGVGMEMFQRPYQKALDRYVAGATDEATMLEDTEYRKRWGYDWNLYRPIVDFCRRNRVPVGGLNVSDELRSRVRQFGIDELKESERKELGTIDFHVKKHRDHWTAEFAKMKGHGEMSKESVERFYKMMTIWDEYMADSAAKLLKERKLRRVVVLAGSGHIDRNFGIPDRAAKRGGKSVSLHVTLNGDLEKLKADPPADFVLIVR